MQKTGLAEETIEEFFARYTRHMTEGDIDALAEIYNYPALAVSAAGCLAINDPAQTREFFQQNREYYLSRGIRAVDVEDIVTEIETPTIWVGHLKLVNLDEAGAVNGKERNAYQVVRLKDGSRKIAVTTPLDAPG